MIESLIAKIKNLKSDDFDDLAIELFQWQARNIPVYKTYIEYLNIDVNGVKRINDIPFLPVSFFKTHQVSQDDNYEKIFKSSGTSKQKRSQHFVKNLDLYHHSILNGFEGVFGKPNNFTYLGLLPNYIEQGDSSLIHMVNYLMSCSNKPDNGYYLNDYKKLNETLERLRLTNEKTILIGVTYALLDFIEKHPLNFPNLIILETGGMKGRKTEMIKTEVLALLKQGFRSNHIYSEYGMTEMLSQAYAKENKYVPSSTMKIVLRDIQDPFLKGLNQGGINVIDLSNIYSCAFIETMDLGKLIADNQFEILGRFDHAEIRGCNLMVSNI